jgi:hypothetical protein
MATYESENRMERRRRQQWRAAWLASLEMQALQRQVETRHRYLRRHPFSVADPAGARFWWGGIIVQVQERQVLLSYRIRRGDENWWDIEEPVPLPWTPCHYGGQRAWFRCPGWGCGRRMAKLYLGGRYFLCRYCHNLVYESQREDDAARLLTKAQKIRQRLGGSTSLMEPFPDKPKGMHWQTYERLRWMTRESETTGLTLRLAQVERISPRLEMETHVNSDR